MDNEHPALARKLGLALLTFYGLGNILGAGIYVLVGKVAGSAGYFTPLAFLVAAAVAGITALTYAELSSRYPYSAGEAIYIQRGFGFTGLSVITGLLIAAAGMLSAATMARGFSGYLQIFTQLPDIWVISLLLISLGALAAWGIAESIRVAALFTLIEIFGLILIIQVGSSDLSTFIENFDAIPAFSNSSAWTGVLLGAFLAFYAFIGFEDMVNVAEEVKNPSKTMPRAIFSALIIASILYGLVGLVAVSVLTPVQLAQSDAPLAMVYSVASGSEPVVITLISLFAIINGALIQIIMASRIFYGMSRQGWLPHSLSQVNQKTQTPVFATILTTLCVISLALWFPLIELARYTSYLILIIFFLVNVALLKIREKEKAPEGVRTYPMVVPIAGAIGSLLLFTAQIVLS